MQSEERGMEALETAEAAPGVAAMEAASLAHSRALEAAARAHAVAAEAERAAGELFGLLDPERLGEPEALDAALLIRDARLRARAAVTSAHVATGEIAAAASELAIALRRVSEYAGLHRTAREAIADSASHGDGRRSGDTSFGG
jgi:hypothetical protein